MSTTIARDRAYELREGVEIRRSDAPRYGGKAATLGDVQQIGCAVPRSLAIPIDAYDAFLRDNALAALAAARAEESATAPAARLAEIEREIAARFTAAAIPPPLVARVLAWADRHGLTTFAVRSSATKEDLAGASFAGQYDSLLHVSRAAVPAAIAGCFASLFNARAALYRRRKQMRGAGAMAVLVQEMLSTDHAGVVFTRAPRRPDHLLIELVPGSCEGAVSGTVAPNRYFLDRSTLAVHRTSEHQAFDVEQVRAIARQALALDAHFGGPQDIEFGLVGGTLYILQARPIAGHA